MGIVKSECPGCWERISECLCNPPNPGKANPFYVYTFMPKHQYQIILTIETTEPASIDELQDITNSPVFLTVLKRGIKGVLSFATLGNTRNEVLSASVKVNDLSGEVVKQV